MNNLTAFSKTPPVQTNVSAAYLWKIALVAAMGGLLFGYDGAVVGGAAKFYEAFFQLKDTALTLSADAGFLEKIRANAISPIGWAQSCVLLGCLIGALVSGALSDRFGRKPLLIAAGFNFALSSIGIALANSFSGWVVWRILAGVSIGSASNIAPMYISEIAPAGKRGMLVAVNQLSIVTGVVAAQFVNWWVARPIPESMSPEAFAASWNVLQGWRWMFAACAAPSILFFIGALTLPESPRWLTKAGFHDKAERLLSRIGGAGYAAQEMVEIKGSLVHEDKHIRFSELFDPRVLMILGLGIGLVVAQQWCGTIIILTYAGEVFKQAGYGLSDALTNMVMLGGIYLLFTFVAIFTVDRLGRKPLMLFGYAALTLIQLAIGYCYHLKAIGNPPSNILFLVLMLAAIASFAMSLAPVTWVIISEIFPNRIRGTAMAITVGSLWIAGFLLTYTFPILNSLLGTACTFWTYAGICLAGFLFVLVRLPETKGRSLENIENLFR